MTMAAAMQSRTAESPARSKASRIAHVDIVTDLAEAETVWRAFEESGHLFTPYQRFDLLSPWQRLAGEPGQFEPQPLQPSVVGCQYPTFAFAGGLFPHS